MSGDGASLSKDRMDAHAFVRARARLHEGCTMRQAQVPRRTGMHVP